MTRKWKRPTRMFSFSSGSVALDRDTARALKAAHLEIALDVTRPYPYVVLVQRHLPGPVYQRDLHRWVWDWLVEQGRRRPLQDDEIIHHLDHDKLNARSENLVARSRRAHAIEHSRTKQRFAPRQAMRLDGFHRPRAPGPLRRVTSGSKDAPTPAAERPAQRPQVTELRERLRDMLPSIRLEVAGLGSWVPREKARAAWDDSATYRLGLRRPAHRLSNAEAALVGLMILNRMDRLAVATAVGAVPGELAQMLARPLVHDSLHHWLHTRGLPYELLPRR